MATGGGGGSAGAGRDDRDLTVVESAARSDLPRSPTSPPARVAGDGGSFVAGGEELGGSKFKPTSDDIYSRAAAGLAQVWKANPAQSQHFTSGLGGVE